MSLWQGSMPFKRLKFIADRWPDTPVRCFGGRRFLIMFVWSTEKGTKVK